MDSGTFCRIFLALLLVLLNVLGLCLGLFLVISSGLILSTMATFGLFSTGIESPLILGIVTGAFLVLLAGVAIVAGFLACMSGNLVARLVATVLLVVYIVVMVVLILLEVATTIALVVSRNEIVDTAGEWYKTQLEKHVNPDNPEYIKNIDTLQTQLECCGFYGPMDYKNTTLGLMGKLPNSCCLPNKTALVSYNSSCSFNDSTLIQTGCRAELEKYVDENIVPIAVVGGFLVAGEVACVVIPIILIIVMFVTAKRDGYEKA